MRCGIAMRIGVLVVALVLGTAAAVGTVFYTGVNTIVGHQRVEKEENELRLRAAQLLSSIAALRQDVLFVSHTPPIQGILRARLAAGIDPLDGTPEAVWRQRLATTFTALLHNKPHYVQVRYIGVADAGREIVRLDRVKDTVVRVADADLQHKARRPYVQETIRLKPGEVYLSDITLNREHGRVVEPHMPMLRAATPVYRPGGEVFGLVVINMDFSQALESGMHQQHNYYITNAAGDFLAHPDHALTFGFDLGKRHRMQDINPVFASLFASGNRHREQVMQAEIQGRMSTVYFVKVAFDPLRPERFLGLAEAIPVQEIVASSRAVRSRSLKLTLLLAAASVLLAYYLSQRLVRPLLRLSQAAGRLADGDFDVSLPSHAEGEIGTLADAFQHMVKQLHEHEKMLEASETKFRHLLEVAPDAMVIVNSNGGITLVNARAEALFGYHRDELLGQPVEILLPEHLQLAQARPPTSDMTVSPIRPIDSSLKILGRRKDNSTFPADITLSRLATAEGTLGISIIRDATNRLQTEAVLHEAKEAAEAANRAKSEFLANVSHELRTPMNGIIGTTALLCDTDLTSEQREYLEMIKVSADSMITLINNLLDFSTLEREVLSLHPFDFNLHDCFRHIIHTFTPRAHQKGLALVYHLAPEVPEAIVGDPGRLRQIIASLLDNAIKFTTHGEVTIRVECPSQTDNCVCLHVSVSDTGIGIPAEQQSLIFKPFMQVDGSSTRQYGGTGLGLAISSRLVEMMGGQMWVESTVGQGSRFHFTATFGM